MVVSQVIFSGIILGPLVDQLVNWFALTSGFTYDDVIMSPLLGSEKIFSSAHNYWPHLRYLI